jgi:hypothetical protein
MSRLRVPDSIEDIALLPINTAARKFGQSLYKLIKTLEYHLEIQWHRIETSLKRCLVAAETQVKEGGRE